MKIVDKIKACEDKGIKFCSFEYFPPKTAAGVKNLYMRIDQMADLEPLFIDITWAAGGVSADLSLQIAKNAQKYLGQETLLHITCSKLDIPTAKQILQKARDAGIMNILALRGDNFQSSSESTSKNKTVAKEIGIKTNDNDRREENNIDNNQRDSYDTKEIKQHYAYNSSPNSKTMENIV